MPSALLPSELRNLPSRKALELQQQIVLIGRERKPVLESDYLVFDHFSDNRIEILHPVDLAVADSVEQGLAFALTLLDIFAGSRIRFQDLDRRDAAFAVGRGIRRCETI